MRGPAGTTCTWGATALMVSSSRPRPAGATAPPSRSCPWAKASQTRAAAPAVHGGARGAPQGVACGPIVR
eukprot:2058948-Lingulodinium_polyedra.AAC.1